MNDDGVKSRKYYHALKLIPSLGPRRMRTLIDYFGSPQEAWQAPASSLLKLDRYSRTLVDEVIAYRSGIDPDKAWEDVLKKDVSVVTWDEPVYPSLLKEIHDPPPVLYYRGKPEILRNPSLAIVGSRKHTVYGKEIACKFAAKLAGYGITIVSGMARGIDSWAHKGVLEAEGKTAAVLGCGPDICYPPENRGLKERITECGLVISEFPPGTPPAPQHFPQRNRIISGLSLGTLVVEAGERSGALITAGFALEQGRDVFAIPAGIGSPYSRGCHKLLKDGAKLVETVEDILEELYLPLKNEQILAENKSIQHQFQTQQQQIQLSGVSKENKFLDLIPYEPRLLDEIIVESKKSAAEVHVLLLELELMGKVKQLPGKYYIRV